MIRSTSPLAVLFASLIVSASGDATAAIDRNLPQKVSYLRSKARPAIKQAWMSAITNDNAEKLAEIFERHEPKKLLEITAINGKSALMVAAKTGHLELARLLVQAGADVNETTETQGTPFMFAVLGDQQDVARWLLRQGADLNTVGSNGWTALTIAAAKGNVHVLQWLIGQGADTQVRDVYRFTPLMRSVENGYVEAAAVLLSLVETNVDARDEYDNTALHHAVSQGSEAMVRLLLEHHANPTLVNRDGISPMALASTVSDNSHVILDVLNKAGQH